MAHATTSRLGDVAESVAATRSTEMDSSFLSTAESNGDTIAFFDVETTVPSRPGQGYALLEFGALLVCPRRLMQIGTFTTLIRPADLKAISASSVRCNGITRDTVAGSPSFRDVADRVFDVLHGRVWAGHNILRFDCARIREAFAEIGRQAPEPKGTIDTLPLLTRRFGRRAGDMKMASLATYFGLGKQRHRSLDDCRLNLEVLKNCAAVLFLESSLSDPVPVNGLVFENTVLPNVAPDGYVSPEEVRPNLNNSASLRLGDEQCMKTRLKTIDGAISSNLAPNVHPSDLIHHMEHMEIDRTASTENGKLVPEILSTTNGTCEGCSLDAGFLEPVKVSTQCISTSFVRSNQYWWKLLLLHKDIPLQLCYMDLELIFGVSAKFVDHAGRPKLSIVVNLPASLCHVLDFCNNLAKRTLLESGSGSEWRSVIKKNVFSNSCSIRLHIPIATNGNVAMYSTEIYQKEPSGSTKKLVFSRIDLSELAMLFVPGSIINAYFELDTYDFQRQAGIRLVANKLVLHSR